MGRDLLLCVILALGWALVADADDIPTVLVGNANNLAHPATGLGSVRYDFRMGRTEISNAQYAEFLNAVASDADPYGLYDEIGSPIFGGIIRIGGPGNFTYVSRIAFGQGPGGTDYNYENKPVTWVSYLDALRFVNWLHNGKGHGDTESGAYTLLGGTEVPSNIQSITRNSEARWWLPSEDEWYKAAFHKNDGATQNYWGYATGSDAVPDNNLPGADTGNSANVFAASRPGNIHYPLTDVGEYPVTATAYGTKDQGGNVWEWNEAHTGIDTFLIGGSVNEFTHNMHAVNGGHLQTIATVENSFIGFRVAAAVPEPNGRTICGAIVLLLTASCRTFRCNFIGLPLSLVR